MDQNGISGRDVTQIGRDFTQKIFEFNLSNRSTPQINIHSQGNSEIASYLSLWEKLDGEQRVKIVVQYIKNSPDLDYSSNNDSDSTVFNGIFVMALVLLFLIMQNPSSRDFIQKTQYVAYSSFYSTICEWDNTSPRPYLCTVPKIVSKLPEYEVLTKVQFETNKKTWYGFIIFWFGLPAIIAYPISQVIEYVVRKPLKHKEQQEKYAKKQTAKMLYSLLNAHEQSLVKDELPFFLRFELDRQIN
ncbi:hypothetical protein [Pseudanabaena sp. 'Roaring Creek']|uniref:hypothetical protein n=1 Tax=Pseudanabaena sp. 'Roaring Creek' TaxID=1681830 RepID=UPI0006D76DA7|nr:hypothetical protein [Pseudanabaena sp. 'Roaring Creek']